MSIVQAANKRELDAFEKRYSKRLQNCKLFYEIFNGTAYLLL